MFGRLRVPSIPAHEARGPWVKGVAVFLFAAIGLARPVVAEESEDDLAILPAVELFVPLEADPRWPRFAAEYQSRLGTDQFDEVAQVNFGETFALVQGNAGRVGRFEVGFQAMVDALFDLSGGGFGLSNEDYYVAFTGTLETGPVTTLLRISHLSSHVGDEYLIEHGGGRESVSYEGVDLLASHQLLSSLRLYGGLGILLDPSPAFDPVALQAGLEWKSDRAFLARLVRPVLALDAQVRQENDWEPEVSVLAALRLANPERKERHVDLYARFYHGHSLEGQFYRSTLDAVSVGLRLGF